MGYSRLDNVFEWASEPLVVGRKYKLGIAEGPLFNMYVVVRIHSITKHPLGDSYLVSGDTGGYLWAVPPYSRICNRIATAEEVEDG